jgi:hypothetical protein
MKHQSILQWLVVLIGLLGLVAAGAGLFWPVGGGAYEIRTLRGETVLLRPRGRMW